MSPSPRVDGKFAAEIKLAPRFRNRRFRRRRRRRRRSRPRNLSLATRENKLGRSIDRRKETIERGRGFTARRDGSIRDREFFNTRAAKTGLIKTADVRGDS